MIHRRKEKTRRTKTKRIPASSVSPDFPQDFHHFIFVKAGHGARLVSRHVDKLKRLGSIGGKEEEREEESNNFEPSSCSTDYDAVTPFQQKSISTANSPCEQNLLGLSLSLSAASSPVFRGCTEREREKAHNWLGYAHLFQPDNGWTAAKIHAYVYSTRRGYFQRTDFLRLFVVAFRGGEHFWYRLLAIIPLLTLNAFSLSLFSYSSLIWEDNRGETILRFVIAIKFLLFRMILFSITIISVKGNELNSLAGDSRNEMN